MNPNSDGMETNLSLSFPAICKVGIIPPARNQLKIETGCQQREGASFITASLIPVHLLYLHSQDFKYGSGVFTHAHHIIFLKKEATGGRLFKYFPFPQSILANHRMEGVC